MRRAMLRLVLAVTEIGSGPLAGEARNNHVVFRGIPFAAPPIGRLRFAPPEPVEPWTELRQAREFGPSAMQAAAFAPGAGAEGPISEDCLYVNVYTPALDGRRRPVLVFIHGGAFIVGASRSPLYDGGRLAELGDQVVVTFNYRLGAFGYLCLGEEGAQWGAEPNLGLQDQLFLLRWVKANIARFGGDPENVTVFGESAGGTSVLLLLAMPAANGLFERAIAQSAGTVLPIAEPAAAINVAAQLLDALNLRFSESEKLRELPAEAILDAQTRVRGRPSDWLGFFPVLDPKTVPRQPGEVFASGGGARVPLIIGSNRDEWNLFEPPARADAEFLVDAMNELVAIGFPERARDRIPALVEVYRGSRRQKSLPHHDRALMRAMLGDMRFRIPSIRVAEMHAARGLPTYAYMFSYVSPARGGSLGACHALELPFVFGTFDAPLQDRFAGGGKDVRGLSDVIMKAWTTFAARGVPHENCADEWPCFDTETRATRVFDLSSRIEHGPHDDERAAWEGIF
jgi:para-nitrobenzyl esterase